jgi:TolB-like protein/Tfp pilus assembly protein PilF
MDSDQAADEKLAGDLQPGTRVGPYVLLDRLGSGGMGVVYLGQDTRLQRRVALKCLTDAGADDRLRVLREARAAGRINHPNVATIHDVIEEGSHTFIVMEYVEGESLARRIGRERLPVTTVIALGRQLAAALAAAHAEGVIHRDLKPANVQLTRRGSAKVLDFGVAKATTSILPTTTHDLTAPTVPLTPRSDKNAAIIPGTPAYMSPEQLFGEPLDERSDIYSLGVVVFEMATGRRPYEAMQGFELAMALTVPPPRADALNPAVPRELAIVIARALERDPHRRFQSAAEMEAALEALDRAPDHEGRRTVAALTPGIVLTFALVVALAGLAYYRRLVEPPPRHSGIRSVAVLPLINLSNDVSKDYFVDGVTDGLINSLGRLGALKVTARTSVMPFKGSSKSVSQIARELRVDAVLEGSAVLERGETGAERVRVAVNLIDPATQTQIWSETIERPLVSVVSLQNEIARALAAEINVAVSGEERKRLATDQRVDPDAYKLYLQGRTEWTARTVPSLRKALDYFNQAVAKDPAYAAAHAGIADTYVLLAGDYAAVSRDEGAARAIAAASRALALDPNLAEACTSLAFTNFFLNWNFAAADEQFRRALILNPSYATAHQWYGNYLSDMGQEEEALVQMRWALDLDPLSPIISRDVAWPLFFSRRYDEALAQLNTTLMDHPGYLPAERLIARTYAQKGDTAEAVRRFEALKQRDDTARSRAELAWAYARDGRKADAERELIAMRRMPSSAVYPYDLALVLTVLNRPEAALDALEEAYRQRDPTMVNLKHDPRLEPLRTRPRFAQLLSLMRFPGGRGAAAALM